MSPYGENTMYVYLIQSGKKKSDPVKVGYSKNPEARIKTLQTGNPKILRLLMKIKCNSCGYEQKAMMPEKTPKGTVRIESNFCHKCDGDYYEEEHFDRTLML